MALTAKVEMTDSLLARLLAPAVGNTKQHMTSPACDSDSPVYSADHQGSIRGQLADSSAFVGSNHQRPVYSAENQGTVAEALTDLPSSVVSR